MKVINQFIIKNKQIIGQYLTNVKFKRLDKDTFNQHVVKINKYTQNYSLERKYQFKTKGHKYTPYGNGWLCPHCKGLCHYIV